jgi:hypothetical protein
VKEIDYTKLLVWVTIVAVVCALSLLKPPTVKQNPALPGVSLEDS